jgi:uncharacterized delta-60 repeat protein
MMPATTAMPLGLRSRGSASRPPCAVEPLEGRALLSAGDLDTTFSGDGKLVTDLGNHTHVGGVAVQADGKILVAAHEELSEEHVRIVLLRYRTDGSLDPTFGSGGKVLTSFTAVSLSTDLDLAPDGKIVLTAEPRTWRIDQTGTRFIRGSLGVARFNSNGTLDRTFSGDGKAVVDFGAAGEISPRAAAIQADGKIVVVGDFYTSSATSGGSDFVVTRLTASGNLDTSFGTRGRVQTGFGTGQSDLARDVAVGPDGKIVAVGTSGQSNFNGVLARYTPSGRLDTTFSGDGRVYDRSQRNTSQFVFVRVRSDRKIIVANARFQTRRYNLDGGVDGTYGVGGLGSVPVTRHPTASSAAVGSDGKLYVIGTTDFFDPQRGRPDFMIVRYLSNGRLDTTFGRSGVVRTNLLGMEFARDGALAPGNRLVVAGPTNVTDDAPFKIGVVRYRTV